MARDETPQDGLEARLGKFDARLDRLSERIEQAGGIPVEQTAEVERPSAGERFVLFIPSPSGYELAEREGQVPAAGETIELREGAERYQIVKLGPSPLPGDGRRCAYLQLA